MKEVEEIINDPWFVTPDDIELRECSDPIDWIEFQPKTINDKYLIRQLNDTDKDFEEAADVFITGFPVIKDTEFDILFKPIGFRLLLGEGEQFNRGDRKSFVVEEKKTGKVISCILVQLAKKQRNAEYLVISTHHDYKKSGVAKELVIATDEYLEQCGIEMSYVLCAVEHVATQKMMLQLGFRFRGVVPGFYRIWAGGKKYKRTVEVYAQKFYNGGEAMFTKHIHLLPEVKEMILKDIGEYDIKDSNE